MDDPDLSSLTLFTDACHAQCKTDALISDHETYLALGTSPEARCAAYGALFGRESSPEVAEVIHVALNRGLPLGEKGSKDPFGLTFSRSARLSLHRHERGGEQRKF